MRNIAPNVMLLERVDWGADPSYPRLGGPEDPRGPFALVPRPERLYSIVHHTVGVDNDATPNVWENVPEIRAMMHRLQLDRPDLGADVPYNFVAFLMADRSLIICEGRGYDRWGAHTAGVAPGRADAYRYFNGCGIATSYAGDFENYAFDFDPWMAAIKAWLASLRREVPTLGTRTICGRVTCGHKDFAPYSSLNQTACPGQHLYARLDEFTFDGTPEEEDDCTMPVPWARDTANGKSYIIIGGRKRHVESAAQEAAYLKAKYIVRPEVLMTSTELATIPDA